jgi:hypothetical protein
MWRPADPLVIARIVCDQKQKFIRRANRVFVPDPVFLQMKKDHLVETYTPITYRVSATMKPVNLTEMRSLCKPDLRATLERETVINLRKIAQQHGVKGYYKYTKNQLIESIHRKCNV